MALTHPCKTQGYGLSGFQSHSGLATLFSAGWAPGHWHPRNVEVEELKPAPVEVWTGSCWPATKQLSVVAHKPLSLEIPVLGCRLLCQVVLSCVKLSLSGVPMQQKQSFATKRMFQRFWLEACHWCPPDRISLDLRSLVLFLMEFAVDIVRFRLDPRGRD